MLMTTNTIWTPIAYENLADFAGLTSHEAETLTALEPHAAAVAPAFVAAVFSRLLQNCLYVSPIEYELGKSALEKWFIHLFRDGHTVGTPYSYREHPARLHTHLHRKSGIPVYYILSLMEVILKFGKRVTHNSLDPQEAFSAFQKVLGLEFALNQVYEENYITHLSELMLDD